MKYSGLNAQEQWSLLNANVPLSALSQYNQAQTQTESTALAARVAASLVNTSAQVAAAKAQAAVSKPTVSTPLQTTTQQRKSDMKQEEYETRFYEKQARRPIVASDPSDTTKTPEGDKPVVDSRDAMEQKKDRAWDKIVVPTWREKREDEIWEPVKAREKTESFPELDPLNDTPNQPKAKDKKAVDELPNSKHIEMFNLGDPNPYRLSDGEYYYVDESAVLGGFVFGHTVVFDAEKYAEYKYVGYSVGNSLVPADHLWVKGYVNNIYKVEDFEGAFVNFACGIGHFGSSASLGYNKDRQVYIVSASNVAQQLFAGAGLSLQYFTSLTPDWVTGEAPIRWGTTIYDWAFNNYYPQEV